MIMYKRRSKFSASEILSGKRNITAKNYIPWLCCTACLGNLTELNYLLSLNLRLFPNRI